MRCSRRAVEWPQSFQNMAGGAYADLYNGFKLLFDRHLHEGRSRGLFSCPSSRLFSSHLSGHAFVGGGMSGRINAAAR